MDAVEIPGTRKAVKALKDAVPEVLDEMVRDCRPRESCGACTSKPGLGVHQAGVQAAVANFLVWRSHAARDRNMSPAVTALF